MITPKTCRQCGATFPGGPRAWYCPNCRAERIRAADRLRKRLGPARPLGSTDVCPVCGGKYTVIIGNQKYCPACARPAVMAIDRAQGLAYYTANKDEINPARNAKRRVPPKACPECGAPVTGGRVRCAGECARKHKNRQWMARYYRQKAPPEA